MQHEQRVLVRVSIDAAGRPTPASQFRPGRRRLARWRPPADAMSGNVVLDGEPTIVKLANSWVIINVGGGPTDDKPEVVLEPPADPTRASAFLNIRVADIQATYQEWRSPGSRVPHSTQGPQPGDPLLHARPRRAPDRGWPDDRRAHLSQLCGGIIRQR
jgi:hypothetical protein